LQIDRVAVGVPLNATRILPGHLPASENGRGTCFGVSLSPVCRQNDVLHEQSIVATGAEHAGALISEKFHAHCALTSNN
jgi:hypothetical protein